MKLKILIFYNINEGLSLNSEEIDYLNNLTLQLVKDIIFNLSLDGNSNDTIYDISGNDNLGAIYGATWVEVIEGCINPNASN